MSLAVPRTKSRSKSVGLYIVLVLFVDLQIVLVFY
jgi:hypothetical protein